jgi:hypothetical protein
MENSEAIAVGRRALTTLARGLSEAHPIFCVFTIIGCCVAPIGEGPQADSTTDQMFKLSVRWATRPRTPAELARIAAMTCACSAERQDEDEHYRGMFAFREDTAAYMIRVGIYLFDVLLSGFA